MRLVAATTNPNKLAEMEPVLAPVLRVLGLAFEPLPGQFPEVVEDRSGFAGNAAKKALEASRWADSLALAEDSGLEVEALGGEPGVRSARYSGQGTVANNRLLLARLAGVPAAARGARFRTVAVVKMPEGPLVAGQGLAGGRVLTEARGHGGFGYDPVFLSKDLGRTFAEAAPREKRRVSHRSKALRAVRGYLFEIADAGAAASGPVPGHATCLAALAELHCPPNLVEHQLAIGRVSREMALLLSEAGVEINVRLVAAAGLLHDVGRVFELAGASPPPGVTPHAHLSAVWAAQQGLAPELARVMLLHGLDSLASADYFPRTWAERIVMLADKMVEDSSLVGVKERLRALRQRYPAAASLVELAGPLLDKMEADTAGAAGLSLELFRDDLAACLDVAVLPPEAGVEDVEGRFR